MSTEVMLRSIFVFVICTVLAVECYFRKDEEVSLENLQRDRARYRNIYPMYLLPAVMAGVMVMTIVNYGFEYSWKMLLSWCFGIFTHISFLYLFLLMAIPFLRKHLSARSCAELWMLPTFLYLLDHTVMSVPEPLIVIRTPNGIIRILMIIWLVGACLVFAGYMISHMLYRHRILKAAVNERDDKIRKVWREERERANIAREYEIVISPATKTPLSIGLFKRTTKIVLPHRNYTEEELHMIFRHELIHIEREDSGTKFFMIFCTSFCWFNPLMWMAMRKSAEDLELSCDEMVLLHAEKEKRRTYAKLILETVGDNRGFTTCLSASATALRYRLSSIMEPRKRLNGGLVVGFILFVFMMTSGYIALAYENTTGEEVIFYAGSLEEHELRSVRFDSGEDAQFYNCIDKEALKKYLADLKFRHITGNYTFSQDEHEMICVMVGDEGAFGVRLTDSAIRVSPLYETDRNTEHYYLESEMDWNYMMSLLEEQ